MEKIDARTLNQEAQEALRNQIVRLRKAGRAHKEIAEIVGFTESHCSRIWTRYQKDGANSVAKGKRGRRQGEQRNLSAEQEAEIKRLIIDKAPNQLKLSFALWTRDAVRLLIAQRYGFCMPIRTVGEYLKRWGFTPQKPARWASEQSTHAIANWLRNEYPDIEKRAKQEKVEIHWGNECGIQTGANAEKRDSPNGKTPMLRQTGRKDRINMISAITNQGKVRFMFYKETMNSKRLITFMGMLIKDAGRKVCLILGNQPVHHCGVVTDWLEKNKDKIEVFCMPSYSPKAITFIRMSISSTA